MKYRIESSTVTLRNKNVFASVNQSEAGSYIVISNDAQKLFEYHKKTLDTQLLQFIIDRKLLNCINLN